MILLRQVAKHRVRCVSEPETQMLDELKRPPSRIQISVHVVAVPAGGSCMNELSGARGEMN